MTSFQGFKGFFGGKKSEKQNNDRHITEIGRPTNVVHDIHVGKNAFGELEGKEIKKKVQIKNSNPKQCSSFIIINNH